MKAWRSPAALSGAAVVALAVLVAVLAPFLTTADPIAQHLDLLLAPPSANHLLGTDELGRDTYSRLLFGARTSLGVGLSATAIALCGGLLVGLVAGWSGGWIDTIAMRAIDGLLAFPALVLALAITATLGPNVQDAIVAIGVTGIPAFARLARGQVLATKHLDFVQSARAIGASGTRILMRHVMPNIAAPLIVQTSLAIPAAIIAEAALGFLGLGVQPPTPSWGTMINSARSYLEADPLLVLAPGAAIFVTVLAFNFLGDAVRDALDPRLL
ncbi:MAG: ABC transporter permease [Candidatus Eremiobacteraeota bacterium]|nr:ABC transporter permease [Candidatus Eremiobacteraeota bacterium]MBV8356205.1 ABC transporter permease [Candidatus Eremiobacteraeota bacterium]